MATEATQAPSASEFNAIGSRPVRGPVPIAWRESALTRAKELESLCAWIQANPKGPPGDHTVLANSVNSHLEAVRQAAEAAQLMPKARPRFFRNGALLERALSNLDAAEAELLNFAPASYVLGQMPSLLRHVQCHLIPTDPARKEFERIAQRLGVKDADNPSRTNADRQKLEQIVDEERGKIVTTIRAAGSAKLREQVRVRSFRSVLIVTTVVMMLLAISVALVGFYRPTLIHCASRPRRLGRRWSSARPLSPTRSSPPRPPGTHRSSARRQCATSTTSSGTPPPHRISWWWSSSG